MHKQKQPQAGLFVVALYSSTFATGYNSPIQPF